MHTLLNPVDTVWDLSKVGRTHRLLGAVEGSVVGANKLQHATSQGILQRDAVCRATKGRAHHVRRRRHKILVPPM